MDRKKVAIIANSLLLLWFSLDMFGVKICFLQALFGKSCKIFLDIVACPNWTKLQRLQPAF